MLHDVKLDMDRTQRHALTRATTATTAPDTTSTPTLDAQTSATGVPMQATTDQRGEIKRPIEADGEMGAGVGDVDTDVPMHENVWSPWETRRKPRDDATVESGTSADLQSGNWTEVSTTRLGHARHPSRILPRASGEGDFRSPRAVFKL